MVWNASHADAMIMVVWTAFHAYATKVMCQKNKYAYPKSKLKHTEISIHT
jgi:hypothetical protein